MSKKFIIKSLVFSIFAGVLFLAGCSGNGPATPGEIILQEGDATALTELPPIWDVPERPEPETVADQVRTNVLLQLTPLTPGELLVTMHTSMGDITMRFFPTEAPQAVENFLTHAWNGYYNGLNFHRVIDGFMMQGGCPEGTGAGGESIWGGSFGQELSGDLRHFRGALAMAQSAAPNSIGSQFYIVQSTDIDPNSYAQFRSFLEQQDEVWDYPDGSSVTVGEVFTEESLNHFINHGGTPFLDWHFSDNPHTVFGHVVSGMDVVDAIVSVPTQNDQPITPITIDSFTFFTYRGGA